MSKRSEIGQMSLFGAEDVESVAGEEVVPKKVKATTKKGQSATKKGQSTTKKVDSKAASAMEKAAVVPKIPKPLPEYDHTQLFERLARSDFRRSFHLCVQDRAYIDKKGLGTIQLHAEDFVEKRLAPANPHNDGSQTPMRGHPVFRAQHATGCCCRGCFEKWHHIPAGRPLTEKEQLYAVSVLMSWIRKEMK